jgi:thioredoxin-related protein
MGRPAAKPVAMPLSRRDLLLGTASLLAGASGRAAETNLPRAHALQQHLADALARGLPLTVMVSLPGCPFCKVVRDQHLTPLLQSRAAAVVQVDMGSPLALLDWAGQPVSHAEQVRRWAVKVAPTLLFFGQQGKEVAERLVGSLLPDFYGAYLMQRLETARQALA